MSRSTCAFHQILITLSVLLTILVSCQNEAGFLIKIHEGKEDEMEARSGYINAEGDTVISLGKYAYCFTDTFVNYAIVLQQDGRCVAIDRSEKELYEVYWYDNGPDYLSDGLFRIRKNGKIGYADEEGQIRIDPQFACAGPFENGRARVAYTCDIVPDGEHSSMESDQWFYIDRRGSKME